VFPLKNPGNISGSRCDPIAANGNALPSGATMEDRMPLRGRVGRHTQSGRRHCQNLIDDQKTVIGLLTGECCRVPPYHFGAIRDLTQPLMLDPEPIRRD
jgi:hypothetical protein